jgi:tetratricopeptide (TPR) repeat protein
MKESILSLAFACLLAPGALPQGQAPQLGVGKSQWGSIKPDDPRLLLGSATQRLQLLSKSDGKVTISASSFDFDVFLRVETEAGDILKEDDDSGVETNARLVVELQRNRTYQVFVVAKANGSGWFWVDCQPGEHPALPRAANLIAAIAFHGGAANKALSGGDKPSAASHLERKGFFLGEQAKLEDAKQAWDTARSLWADVKDKKQEAHATLELGRIASALKDWTGAEQRFSEALAAYRALPDAAGEARTLLSIADARAAAGDPAAAAARYGEALAVAEKLGDTEATALALGHIADLHHASGDRGGEREALQKLGDLWRAKRDLPKARERHQQAAGIARETKNRAGEGAAWTGLGLDWLEARDWAHARECFESAHKIALEIGDPHAQFEALEGLGRVWFGMHDYAKSLQFHEQQLAAAGTEGTAAGQANLKIGRCLVAIQDFARARTCLEAELKRAKGAGDHLAEADALEYLSNIEIRTGHPEKGLKQKERAKSLRTGSGQDEAWSRLGEGTDQIEQGNISKAQEILERCLEESRASGDALLRMEIQWSLALCHSSRGRYAEAIRCSTDMVDIARTLGRRIDEGEGLECLGVEYCKVGALDSALKYLEEALSIARESSDPEQELDTLNDVANVWLEFYQQDKALEIYGKVVELARKLHQNLPEAAALNNIGLAHFDAERYAESRPFFEQAVQFGAEMQLPAYYVAEFRGQLARALRKLGDRERAQQLATDSLAVLGAPDSSEPEKSLIPLSALAAIAIGNGDAAGAGQLLERARGVLEDVRLQVQATPEEVGVNPWHLYPPWDRYTQDLVRLQDLEGDKAPSARNKLFAEGFRAADRARARELASGITEHRRGTRSKDALAVRSDWKKTLALLDDKQREVSQAIRDDRPSEDVGHVQQEALALRTKAEELGLALRAISPQDAELDLPDGIDPAAVRNAGVTKGCALIEYAEGDEDLYAYVLTESDLRFFELGKRKVVDEAVERYLGLIGSQLEPASAAAIAKDGRELYDRLLATPLAAAGAGVARILVIPTPSLAVLPFDALVVSAKPEVRGFGDLEFVIEHCEVDYCPSASILVGISTAGLRKLAGKVLVLADPVYPSEEKEIQASASKATSAPSLLAGTRSRPEGKEFGRLIKTREEAFAIATTTVLPEETEALARLSRLHDGRGGSLRAKYIDLCLGSDASAAMLAGDLRPYSVIHIAAHGWVDGESPEKTGVALAWSGTGPYQGFFTIADAVGLDLDANLVVLSACDTALGKVRAGEGVESMAIAFLHAGTRGVVASLWQVVDWVAAETMKSFYERILGKDHEIPAEALHAAKLAIRRGSGSRGLRPGDTGGGGDEGSPRYWAPFIYIGPPR